MRHRRRCLRSIKAATRQKACHRCVQAKAKCCYSQPACSRCVKRGLICRYAENTTVYREMPVSARKKSEQASHTYESPDACDSPSVVSSHSPPTISAPDTEDGSWTSKEFPWPLDVTSLPSLEFDPAVIGGSTSQSLAISASYPAMANTSPIVPIPPSFQTQPIPTPPNDFIYSRAASIPQQPSILTQYPDLLLQDDFSSPFLHRALFAENSVDMTKLPHTSMAICCGNGRNTKNGARYIQRAMDAQRQMIIEGYPAYICIEQWDALHAMLLYEILELSTAQGVDIEDWKRKICGKGLKSPFLLKMAVCYTKEHSKALMITPETEKSWVQWAVAETIRRTVFLANMINFISNWNHETGKQSPYYDPINDELILSLPLPCSQRLWNARSEEAWQMVVQTGEAVDVFGAPTPLQGLDVVSSEGVSLNSGQTLRALFANFSKEYIRANLGAPGLGDSDQLWSLIILYALDQF